MVAHPRCRQSAARNGHASGFRAGARRSLAASATHVKIAHLADLHLGYRAYHRSTPRGMNQREADVADAFRRAVAQVAELGPDLVVIAGDVFHTVRPSNTAIAEAFRQLSVLTGRLPGVPVVMIAG